MTPAGGGGASRLACAALAALGVRGERPPRRAPVRVSLDGTDPGTPLRLLLEAGVTVRAFELEGARLSDAFLEMTEAA